MEDINDKVPLYTPPLETFNDYLDFVIMGNIGGIVLIGMFGLVVWAYRLMTQHTDD